MKGILVLILPAIAVSILSSPKSNRQIDAGERGGFAVVELFTSEGCSSCPHADEVLEEIQQQYINKNVIVLGYHVDYWNWLGWKDIFSDASYTKRQEYYANIFGLNSIYTPQAIINGKTEFIGSNRTRLINSIEEQLKGKAATSINLKANENASRKIQITYSTNGTGSKQEQLIVLLVQKSAANKIKRGENEGRTLHHINIVRKISYLPIPLKESNTTFDLSSGLKKEDAFIAAFIQNRATGNITGFVSGQIE